MKTAILEFKINTPSCVARISGIVNTEDGSIEIINLQGTGSGRRPVIPGHPTLSKGYTLTAAGLADEIACLTGTAEDC